MASFPTATYAPASKSAGQTIQAAFFNDPEAEIVAIEGELRTTGLTNTLLVNAGVKFPASQAASSDANTIDDYKESTWTPGVSFGGGTTGVTYTSQSGHYLKVGKNVWFTGNFTLSAKGSSTGTVRITGLPFAEGDNQSRAVQVGPYFNVTGLAAGLIGYIDNSATTIVIYQPASGGATAVTDAAFQDNTLIVFSGWYRAAN